MVTPAQGKGLGGLLEGVGANLSRGKRQALELSRRRSDGPSEIPLPFVVRRVVIPPHLDCDICNEALTCIGRDDLKCQGCCLFWHREAISVPYRL